MKRSRSRRPSNRNSKRHNSRRPRRQSSRRLRPKKSNLRRGSSFRKPRKKFHARRINHFARKHPITIGVILIIASFILFRLSFTNQFLSSAEVVIWTWIISLGLFIAGVLVLVGWWKNNILNINTGHQVTWRNR